MTTLVIDRSRWLRGEKDSGLLRADGKMCCLGFYGLSCGYSEDDIRGQGEPAEMCLDREEEHPRWPEWLLAPTENDYGKETPIDTSACIDLIEANDSILIPDEEREQKIAAIFASHGVEVVFR